MSVILDSMQRVAMTFAAMLGLPVAIGGAAPLHPAGAWAPAAPPGPVESPAAPEVVPVQQPTVEPPATAEEPATTAPVDTVSPERESGPVAVEAAPKTEDATTPEPEPDPAPTRSVVPPWPAPPRGLPPAEPPPPPGTGMRVGGGILIGVGGLDVLAGGLGLAALASSSDPANLVSVRRLSIAQMVIGLVEVGAGIGLVVPGVRRSDHLTAWQSEHGVAVPKTGNGMIVGGSVLLGLGAFDGIVTGVLASQMGYLPSLDLVIAIGEVGAGAALLGVGLVRKKRYREWERNLAVPSVSLLPGGMAMSLRGRF